MDKIIIKDPSTKVYIRETLSKVIIKDNISKVIIKQVGTPGPMGEKGNDSNQSEFIVGNPLGIGGHRIVYLDISQKLQYATSFDLKTVNKIIGMSLNASSFGAVCRVQSNGLITDNSFSFKIDYPIYLADNGLITQIYPIGGCCKVLGYPITSTSFNLNINGLNIQQ